MATSIPYLVSTNITEVNGILNEKLYTANLISTVFTIILTIIGLIGNFLSLIILAYSSLKMRSSSTHSNIALSLISASREHLNALLPFAFANLSATSTSPNATTFKTAHTSSTATTNRIRLNSDRQEKLSKSYSHNCSFYTKNSKNTQEKFGKLIRQKLPRISSKYYLTAFLTTNILFLLSFFYSNTLNRIIFLILINNNQTIGTINSNIHNQKQILNSFTLFLINLNRMDSSYIICKAINYINNFCSLSTSIIIFAFSFERLIAVYEPIKLIHLKHKYRVEIKVLNILLLFICFLLPLTLVDSYDLVEVNNSFRHHKRSRSNGQLYWPKEEINNKNKSQHIYDFNFSFNQMFDSEKKIQKSIYESNFNSKSIIPTYTDKTCHLSMNIYKFHSKLFHSAFFIILTVLYFLVSLSILLIVIKLKFSKKKQLGKLNYKMRYVSKSLPSDLCHAAISQSANSKPNQSVNRLASTSTNTQLELNTANNNHNNNNNNVEYLDDSISLNQSLTGSNSRFSFKRAKKRIIFRRAFTTTSSYLTRNHQNYLLLTISITFLLTNVPFHIIGMICLLEQEYLNTESVNEIKLKIFSFLIIIEIFQVLNHSITSLLLFLSGKSFRFYLIKFLTKSKN